MSMHYELNRDLADELLTLDPKCTNVFIQKTIYMLSIGSASRETILLALIKALVESNDNLLNAALNLYWKGAVPFLALHPTKEQSQCNSASG